MKIPPLDKVIETIVGLGIPGLVLLTAMAASGWAGGAAIVTALAVLGGPLGMLGGIAALVLMASISRALAAYGFASIAGQVVRRLKERGESNDAIRQRVLGYPISRGMKQRILERLTPHLGSGE